MTSTATQTDLAALGERRANRVVNFIQKRLYLTNQVNAPFILIPEHKKMIRELYGTLRPDGKRQYSRAFIAWAKKNAKTEIAAALACYHLFPEGDGVWGAEVYAGAASRGQASIMYRNMRKMINQSPALRGRVRFKDTEKRIEVPESEAFFQVLSADADYSDGINPTFVIVDELHRHKRRDLWDILKNGSGTRDEPLLISITTAGNDRTHVCYTEWAFAEEVAAGIVDAPSLFVDIRSVPLEPDDAWKKEENWYLANPGLGIFLDIDEFRAKFNEVLNKPTEEASFRRLRCNQWVQTSTPWLAAGAWAACGTLVGEKELAGRDCYAFLDMSSGDDFTAWALWFPHEDDEGADVLCRHWVPEVAIEKRENMKPQLLAWAKAGLLNVIPGKSVDDRVVRKQIDADLAKFHILEIGFDEWACRQLGAEYAEAGVPMVSVRPYFSVLHTPTMHVAKLVYDKKLCHMGDPVLEWQVGNVVLEKKDNFVRPSKDFKKIKDKIDGAFAVIGACERSLVYEQPQEAGCLVA